MKTFKKIFLGVFVVGIFGSAISYAQEHIFFYGNGCAHCVKVEQFFNQNPEILDYNLSQKEIYFDEQNREDFRGYVEILGLDPNAVGVPFLVIKNEIGTHQYRMGDTPIINYFNGIKQKPVAAEPKKKLVASPIATTQVTLEDEPQVSTSLAQRLSFFGIMLPAALADSINPCAFAVILILLSSIIVKSKSRKRALRAGILFCLSVFITYFVMGLGLFSALATATNTTALKIVIGILGILVGLANFKDFFRYGKGFVMEVPFSRRPKLQSLMTRVTSPMGGFVVGFLVSLFLLPCTSGPYFTILGYLASESQNLHFRGYIYLIVYNLIFILPMLIITLLVAGGRKSAEELAAIKNKNKKLIHLIVGFLMLGLGLYVLLTL